MQKSAAERSDLIYLVEYAARDAGRTIGVTTILGETPSIDDPIGRIVSIALRELGEHHAMTSFVEALTTANKDRPAGAVKLDLATAVDELQMRVPSLSDDEVGSLTAYITAHAEAYWGGPL